MNHDNLIKRLWILDMRPGSAPRQAADKIELLEGKVDRLRRAIKEIAEDCEADYPPSHGAIKYAARAALNETQETTDNS